MALFVLGNGRSGTSALARVLSLCGGALPPGLLGATSENPRGFFEPRAVIHLNQAILHHHGSSGYDMALATHTDGAFGVEQNAAWIAKIRDYLGKLPAAPLLVIKEPKTTTVSGMWFEAARQAGFDVAAVIAVRHPEEIIGSLAKRADQQNYVEASPELTCAWWLKYSLLAERDTRGVPRVFVEYSNLLADWRREVKRISTALAIDLDVKDEGEVDEFLTPDLRHHQTRGAVTEPCGTDWISTVYETLAGWQAPAAGARQYADLPIEAQRYVARLEEITGVPAAIISTGSAREDTIIREDSVASEWFKGAPAPSR